jgi:thioredoxin reductase
MRDVTVTFGTTQFVIRQAVRVTDGDGKPYHLIACECDNTHRFRVESSNGTYERRVLAVAIGIFGRPNKPKEYRLLHSLRDRLLFDMTSQPIQNENVLVVGGGDTAAEYVQYLRGQSNRVILSSGAVYACKQTES